MQPLRASHVMNLNHVMTRHFYSTNAAIQCGATITNKIYPLSSSVLEVRMRDRRAVQEGHLRFPFSHAHARNVSLARSRNGFSYLKGFPK